MKILFIRGDGASFSQVRLWRYTRKRTVSKSVAGRCSWHRLGVARAQAPNNKMRFSFSFHTLCFVCLHTTHQQNHSAASRSGSGDGGNDSNIDVGGGGGSSTSCGGSPCARSAAQHVIVSSTRLYICSIVYLPLSLWGQLSQGDVVLLLLLLLLPDFVWTTAPVCSRISLSCSTSPHVTSRALVVHLDIVIATLCICAPHLAATAESHHISSLVVVARLGIYQPRAIHRLPKCLESNHIIAHPSLHVWCAVN